MLTNVSYNTANVNIAFCAHEKTAGLITQEILSTIWKPTYLYRNENAMCK